MKLNLVLGVTKGSDSGSTTTDFFSTVSTSVSTLASNLQIVAGSVIVLCIVITGVMFMLGDGPSRKAKTWLFSIAIGAIIVWGATSLSTWLRSSSGF